MQQQEISLCEGSVFCQKPKCQLDHSRQYQGFCIRVYNRQKNTDDESDKCQIQNCKLKHFSEEAYQYKLNILPINGIYHHNLCETQCEDKTCQYVHVGWAKGICNKALIGTCKSNECKDKKKHLNWQQLRLEVYEKYNIEIQGQSYNPENLDTDENLKRILENELKFCLSHFQGKCIFNQCSKEHKKWEDIKTINFNQFFKPCTQLENNQINQNYQQYKISEARLFCVYQQLKKFKYQVKKSDVIDIIFIMDLTGSMRPWKKQMELHIQRIIEQFQADYLEIQMRVGFVGYRDRCDKEQIVYHPLTDQVKNIISFVQSQEAKGGGDEAEDVVAGLEQALKLNISQYPQSLLITFLFCDSPHHGRQYHNETESIDDQLKSQIGPNTLESVMIQFKNRKKYNYFFCVEITKKTQQMYNIMSKGFENLSIVKEVKPQDFPELVQFSLSKSIESSLKRSQQILLTGTNSTCDQKINFFVKAEYERFQMTNLNHKIENKNLDYWKQFINNLNSHHQLGDTYLQLNEENEQFAVKFTEKNESNELNCELNYCQTTVINCQQEERTQVFKGFDAIQNKYIIIKIPTWYIQEFEESKKNGKPISNEKIKQTEDYARSRYYTTNIANQMAYKFRNKLQELNIDGIPPIFYVDCSIYKLEKPFKGLTTLYGETFIDVENQKWRKISSNYHKLSKLQQQEFYYTSFSHFTYEESQEKFVILDLQGYKNILSDASIQTKTNYLMELQIDRTNLLEQGIENFKKQHSQCSIICKKLNLSRKGFSELQYDITEWHGDNIHYICQICKQINTCELREYKNQKEMKCSQCLDLEQVEEEITCLCCKKIYKSKIFQEILTLQQYNHCSTCTQECHQKKKKCYYCERYHKQDLVDIEHQFGGYSICRDGIRYLQGLKCQVCQEKFNMIKEKLTPEQYNKKQYACKNH